MSDRFGYVLTIEERYWNRFNRLNKAGKTTHAYVSSGDFLADDVKLIFFYSVQPFKEILGFADFIQRLVGPPKELWDSYGSETCLNSYEEYVGLTWGKQKVTFIRFRNLSDTSKAVSFEQISGILQIERMPQVGMYAGKSQAEKLIEILK
jgi:hypothetical protein